MNTTIETTISECVQRVVKRREEVAAMRLRVVTDAQVAKRIEWLAESGYEPSCDIVEPVRSYMQGFGLLLSGKAGCGKTMLMRLLMENREEMQHVEDILDWGSSGLSDWYSFRDGRGVCIDDLGAERVVSEFGNKDDLLKLVIGHRAERQNGRTHITTNLSASEIATRYGDRVLDRILGMCRPFTIKQRSRRECV